MRREEIARTFRERGFAALGRLLDEADLEALREETDRLLALSAERGGARNGLAESALLRELGRSPALARYPAAVLGEGARPVKLTLFDKTPEANWKVPWHQDLTLAVRERREVAGFGPWSVKGGVPHVQAPAEILARVVALRLHLDDAGSGRGGLRVLPATHSRGRLPRDEIDRLSAGRRGVSCPAAAGEAMLMSPLLLHASSASRKPGHRRVLHFEYAMGELPGGLRWGFEAPPASAGPSGG